MAIEKRILWPLEVYNTPTTDNAPKIFILNSDDVVKNLHILHVQGMAFGHEDFYLPIGFILFTSPSILMVSQKVENSIFHPKMLAIK
jgi:hypothetical protein